MLGGGCAWLLSNKIHPPAFCLCQALDPHANEYMERLKDEAVLLALAQKVGSRPA